MAGTSTSERPRVCAACGGISLLRVIVPSADKPDHDELLFECASCGHAETVFVGRDQRA